MEERGVVAESDGIAIIGMSGRFPRARNLAEYWQNLANGVEAVAFYSEAELLALGNAPEQVRHPHFVGAGAVLEEVGHFDAAFFGFSPRQAATTDPQQRLFLECAWEALESAGYDPAQYPGAIGVYAGASLSGYLFYNLAHTEDFKEILQSIQTLLGNDKDYLATTVSYKFNLQGPSVTVQTACSTSLVAVHLACQSLLNHECDMALAGGVTVRMPQAGYIYQEGGVNPPDGHCRAFDAEAKGTPFGSGVGLVVLKRLADALADGDRIEAVIRGSAINNDGARKVGYTAPSQEGQAQVIAEALAVAGVAPETVTYIEAHGTGTPLGDPIEVAALHQVYRGRASATAYCAIGSVKTNLGHLENAAGIAGLIKTVLALKHQQIPPSLHYTTPNPQIDFAHSPFYVNTALQPWVSQGRTPRRAGVSSFGIGGTNAHVIVEEAPPPRPPRLPQLPAGHTYLLPLSARTPGALQTLVQAYQRFLSQSSTVTGSLYDIGYTASVRRAHHACRVAVTGGSQAELVSQLAAISAGNAATNQRDDATLRTVVFVFSGQGSQSVGMGRALLAQEPLFRATLEQCDQAMRQVAGVDWSLLKELAADETEARLGDLDVIQPCIFAIQLALATLWRSWGVEPAAVVGHSMGEITAACVAGIITLPEAMRIICIRSQLIKRTIGQGVTALVELSLAEAQAALQGYIDRLAVAASNGPRTTLLSGDTDAMADLFAELQAKQVFCRLIKKVDCAAHSPHMDPLRPELLRSLQGLRPQPATLPMYSTVTGALLQGPECDAHYWMRNMREPVLFAPTISQLMITGHTTFVEVSPHPLLLPAIQQQFQHLAQMQPPTVTGRSLTIPSLRNDAGPAEQRVMLEALGTLYAAGYPVAWRKLYPTRGQCVSLPGYPWQRQRYWIDPQPVAPPPQSSAPLRWETLMSASLQQVRQLAGGKIARNGHASRNGHGAHKGAPLTTTHPTPPDAPLSRSQLLGAEPAARQALVEQYLGMQAANLLGIPASRLERTQPLNEQGLDSLMAVTVKQRLRDQLAVDLPLVHFLQNPTITHLTDQVLTQLTADAPPADAAPAPWSPLAPIQPAGHRPPFFCVHPWAGVVYPYYALAGVLGPEQPFYGLQAAGLEATQQPDTSIETMASRYLAALRTVQPSGPYYLGGWSYGGLVAFEMAQQLQQRGEEVALLAILDLPAPIAAYKMTMGAMLKFFVTALSRSIWPYVHDYLALQAAAARLERGEAEGAAGAAADQPPGKRKLWRLFTARAGSADAVAQTAGTLLLQQPALRRIFKTLWANSRAVGAYTPRPYPGRLVLLRVATPDLADPNRDRSWGWQQVVTGGVEVHQIPGHHLDCLRHPHVQVAGATLKACLAQAEAQISTANPMRNQGVVYINGVADKCGG